MPHHYRTASKRRIRKMNLRQHKKFHLAAFQNLTFNVCGSLLPPYRSNTRMEKLTDELLDFIFSLNVCMAGRYNHNGFSFTFDHCKQPPHNITPALRQKIIRRPAARNDIQHLRAGSLIDGFYSNETEYEYYGETYR